MKSLTNQVVSEDAEAIARYSASLELLESVDCFLDFQDTGDLPNNNTYPVTDLLVLGHAAQSESEYAVRVKRSIAYKIIP